MGSIQKFRSDDKIPLALQGKPISYESSYEVVLIPSYSETMETHENDNGIHVALVDIFLFAVDRTKSMSVRKNLPSAELSRFIHSIIGEEIMLNHEEASFAAIKINRNYVKHLFICRDYEA